MSWKAADSGHEYRARLGGYTATVSRRFLGDRWRLRIEGAGYDLRSIPGAPFETLDEGLPKAENELRRTVAERGAIPGRGSRRW